MINTGNIENWVGNISEIKELYPFVGTEMIMVIATVVFWIGWHIVQLKAEKREIAEDVEISKDRKIVEKKIRENS